MITLEKVERTKESIPFNAADQQLIPIDLNMYGYVEEEYFYSGLANVYSLNQGKVNVKTSNAPYKNRFIVRKPKGKCSGRVVFEILNSSNGWDVTPMWALMWKKILHNGDVYVGVTSRAVCVRSLKQFDSLRYQSLSWKNPNPNPKEINRDILMWQHSSKLDEDGLVWDMIQQLSQYLKSEEAKTHLDMDVDKIYATGCSQSAMLLSTFMTQFDEADKTTYASSGFDGYITYSGSRMLSLNQEEGPCPLEITRNVRVPVMRFMSQWDFRDFAGDLSLRREDSDNMQDRFRLYEIAGQAHNSYAGAFYRPGVAEITKLDRQTKLPPSNISKLPLENLVCQGLDNLDQWVKTNVAPPCSNRIEIDDQGHEVLDEYGNCKGGLRYPQLDVPYATYYSGTKENVQESYYVPFSNATLKGLYKNKEDYVWKICKKIDEMYLNRWISIESLEQMKEEAMGLGGVLDEFK